MQLFMSLHGLFIYTEPFNSLWKLHLQVFIIFFDFDGRWVLSIADRLSPFGAFLFTKQLGWASLLVPDISTLK